MIRVRTVTDRARRDAADAERAAGILDRTEADARAPIALDLRRAGGPDLTFRPVARKTAWNAYDADGRFLARGTLKQLLHRFADQLPRQLGARSFG